MTKRSGASEYLYVLSTTMKKSGRVLVPLIFLVALVIVLFGSLIYELEIGDFTVNSSYPQGAFLALTSDGSGREPSAFTGNMDQIRVK